jgi:hypothetical protein
MEPKRRLDILTIVIFLFVFSADCVGLENAAESEKSTTIILIRHAERDNFFILTDDGHKRAQALVDAVGDREVKAIYSPDLERNLDTVRPLANHLKLDISLTPRIQGAVIDQIVRDILARHIGQTVLIVGNGSSHLRKLHQRLGGTGEGPYRYGDLFIYELPDQGPVKVIKSRY